MDLEFFDDPEPFLEAAGPVLEADPVLGTVVAGVSHRIARQRAAGVAWPDGVPRWFAVVRQDGRAVSAAMRTATFGTYPPYVLPMDDDAARALADACLARGEEVGSVNGALPAAQVFAERVARATGRTVRVGQHTRLFEATEVTPPEEFPLGTLRQARTDEVDVVMPWYAAFMADADEQAGRAPGTSAHEAPTREELERRVEEGGVWVWADDADRPVHLTAASRPSYGVVRIGPVYTPREHRGRGYASAAVAAVSRAVLDRGHRVCLFTDQANPTSNKIYEAIGYRRVVDMANLLVV